MKDLLFRTTAICAILAAFTLAANAQLKKTAEKKGETNLAGSIISGTGNVAVVIVKSAAKSVWVTSKFVGKNVAWPVAKTALVKVPQKAALYGLKTVGFSLRKGIPMAGKVGFAYLKAKLP